jgi:hypothetical protein
MVEKATKAISEAADQIGYNKLVTFMVAVVAVLGWGISIGLLYGKVANLDNRVATLETRWLDNHDMIKQIQTEIIVLQDTANRTEKLVEKHMEASGGK